jgi:hypothetical protein
VDKTAIHVSFVDLSEKWRSGDEPFVARVHALVDLVDESERCAGETLQGHEIEYGGDGALAAGLAVVVKHGKWFGFARMIVLADCIAV